MWLIRHEKRIFLARFFLLVPTFYRYVPVHFWLSWLISYTWTYLLVWSTYLLRAFRLTWINFSSWQDQMSNYWVKNKSPENLPAEYLVYFPEKAYPLPQLSIFTLGKAHVYFNEYHGIVWHRGHIHEASIHGYWGDRGPELLLPYYREVPEVYLRSLKGEEVTYLLNPAFKYLLVHHWFNYYHWLTETFYRIWLIKDKLHLYHLLLPEAFKQIEFVQSSLSLFPNLQVVYIPKKFQWIQAENLTMVENKPYCEQYHPNHLQAISQLFTERAKLECVSKRSSSKKLYISRKKVGRRELVNEDELINYSTAQGYTVIIPEDYTFWEQVNIFSEATSIVSVHGAGLTNMLFMPQGGQIVELHPAITNKKNIHSKVYWSMANTLKHHYSVVFCDPADSKGLFEGNLIVDMSNLINIFSE